MAERTDIKGLPDPKPRIALVHDWLVSPGGAERVLLAMHELWPEAPIYTAAYEPSKFPKFADADVRVTWLNKIKLAKKKHQLFSIPRAWAFKGLNLSEYDIAISSSSAEAKYVRTTQKRKWFRAARSNAMQGKGEQPLHICYCHTPIRYYWSDYEWYRTHPPFGALNPLAKLMLPMLIPFLRRMDFKAAQRVDKFIANSKNVAGRIKKYYQRESTVIYPPVDTDRFKAVAPVAGEYYLVLGRQVAYKRLDIVVEAFNELGLPLLVVGTGEEIARQKERSGDNIKYLGRVSEDELPGIYAGSKAFIFPAEEDFGIVMVESIAAGKPVIAYGKGGALEIVEDGKTGVIFGEQTKKSLIDAVSRSQRMTFDPDYLKKEASRFDVERFKTEIKDFVDDAYTSKNLRT